MREAAFLRHRADIWRHFETMLADRKRADPDQLADLFIEITDDLSYARTFYPNSKITEYLNSLASQVHQKIYRNRKERAGRFVTFWQYELPMLMYRNRRTLLYSFIIFTVSMLIGMVSTANDDTFVRLILGDGYVNMTMQNIEHGDPMAVYKMMDQTNMFTLITMNNIMVSFLVFAKGLLISIGTAYELFNNGIMLGSFQYFFYQQGLLFTSILSVWIHGTLEISAIVIAGCGGLVMGNSILFPGTYTRAKSFARGASEGMKIVIGLVPIFIIAGFLESFVTRYTQMPMYLSLGIILTSLAFVLWYFVIYPIHVHKAADHESGHSN